MKRARVRGATDSFVLAILIALIVVCLIHEARESAKCEAAGGVLVKAAPGYACVKALK